MSFAALAALGFCCGLAYDIVNVSYMRAANQGRPHLAAAYSVLLGACGLTGVVESVHTWRVVPFLLAGYYLGTYIAVRRS